MAEVLEAQLLDPNADLRSAMERIEDIVTQEWQLRYNKKFKKFFKRTTLVAPPNTAYAFSRNSFFQLRSMLGFRLYFEDH